MKTEKEGKLICYNCGCKIDDIYVINGNYVCEDCRANNYVCCDDCSTWIDIDNTYNVANDRCICEDCYVHNYFHCESCDEIYHNDYYGGDGYCSYCIDCGRLITNLHDYNYKPCPVFYGKDELHFGIELEIEANGNSIDDVAENLNDYFYAKEDGSLDNGFEIVSHPATWDWLKDHKEVWNDVLNLRHSGFISYNTNTCGMHIHLSKKAFSSLHLYKFLKMFYENHEFILTISRRRKRNLEEYASLESDESIVYKARLRTNKQSQRYTAVNLENDSTVEIRIFRGTLAQAGFWRNVEFCKSLYDYTKESSVKNITTGRYCDYVMKNEGKYPNLSQFLIDKELTATLFRS